jgi:hypothetical protein
LGYGTPGEKLLILPPNSQAVIDADNKAATQTTVAPPVETGNFQQWMNFLFGGNSKSIAQQP